MNSLSAPCFIIFGVSGVGKSTACERFVAEYPNFLYARASSLISAAAHADTDTLRRSTKDQILKNQWMLVDALSEFRAGRETRPVILDAHAVIDNDEELIEVPTEVIRKLCPTGLVLVDSKSATLAARRKRDARQRPVRNKMQLDRELNAERSAVKMYSRALDVPLRTLLGAEEALDEAIRDLSARPASG